MVAVTIELRSVLVSPQTFQSPLQTGYNLVLFSDSGGLEALFGEQKTLKANVPANGQVHATPKLLCLE